MKKSIILLIISFIFYMPELNFAGENDVTQYRNINLLGVKTGMTSDEIISILEEKYEESKVNSKYDISVVTGERYIDKIEVGLIDDVNYSLNRWHILFTDQTIGGSAAFINRQIMPDGMISTKNIINDLIKKFGKPTTLNTVKSLIKIRWHYASDGELSDSMPKNNFIKVDRISGGRKIDLLPNHECMSVYTEVLRGKKSCEGKDVAVDIATNKDGELVKNLSISIRDYDLEFSDLLKGQKERLLNGRTILREIKEEASDKRISF